MKNIKVDEDTWRKLMLVKYKTGKSKVGEIIKELLEAHIKVKRF